MGGYWDVEPTTDSAPSRVRLALPDLQVDLRTDRGVFGTSGVDRGTQVLLRQAPAPAPHTGVLDLGTGYGPIAVALASREPRAGVWAVDVNRRALGLARVNTAGRTNVVVAEPSEVPSSLRFDGLYSNPPIKVGKDALHELLHVWLGRLVPGSAAWLVVKQAMGADSLHRWLDESGHPTVRAASKQGYRVLRVSKPGPRHPGSLRPYDMTTIENDTGGRWTVLGHVAGGHSDLVMMVQRGSARAVLKIKDGDWWPDQLERFVPTVTELRRAGYPAPEIVAAGRLPDSRAYLMTAWAAGRPPSSRPSRAQLEAVLAAAELHRQVSPPTTRDWSAMVTLFLNGGLGEKGFHPALASYVRQALSLVPKPVPALPNGDFVHGDFSFANMLFDKDRVAAVVDAEAFGTGTIAIDLLRLLPELPMAEGRAIVDRAIELTSPDVVTTCLCHRILAGLDWASRHPHMLDKAAADAQHLLRFVR